MVLLLESVPEQARLPVIGVDFFPLFIRKEGVVVIVTMLCRHDGTSQPWEHITIISAFRSWGRISPRPRRPDLSAIPRPIDRIPRTARGYRLGNRLRVDRTHARIHDLSEGRTPSF